MKSGIVRDLFASHVTDDDIATAIRILSKIVVSSGRWADRAAGEDFERSIRRTGQPSVHSASLTGSDDAPVERSHRSRTSTRCG